MSTRGFETRGGTSRFGYVETLEIGGFRRGSRDLDAVRCVTLAASLKADVAGGRCIMTVGTAAPVLKPLKLKCTTSDCGNDLHCFLQKTQKPRPHGGPCRSCGKDLVDFPRVQTRNLGDIQNTFESMSK